MIGLALGHKVLEPGTTLSGTVRWEREWSGHDGAVVVRLLWYTEGKGTEDCGVVREVRFDSVPVSGEERFSLETPVFPWSYAGRLLSVVWAVEAELKPGTEVCRETVVCAPGGREVRP